MADSRGEGVGRSLPRTMTTSRSPGLAHLTHRRKQRGQVRSIGHLPLAEMMRYGLVGMVNTAVGLSVIFFGMHVVGLHYALANAVGYSLAIAAAQSGRRVYYGTLADLVTSLEEARAAGALKRRLAVLGAPSLTVVDEIGYLPVSQTGAVLFFQLMSRRYERASTVLTSNKGFEEWGEVLGDEVMAAALIDRILHHCHIVNIRGNSYRMRQHTELWQALHQGAEESSSRSRRKARGVEGLNESCSVPPRVFHDAREG
jgi:hypothetical protein